MIVNIADLILKDFKTIKDLQVEPDLESPYQHTSFRITNLSDYIKLVEKLEEKRPSNWYEKENYFFYRGIENIEYSLLPSLEINKLVQFEKFLINDFYCMRPDEFYGISSNFEKLAKMQHYGLPTRLLDFTLNPLVGLFFACKSQNYQVSNTDGRVVITLSDFDISNTDNVIETICSTYQCSDDLDNRTKAQALPIFDTCPLNTYMQSIYFDHPEGIMVRPPYITERERRQNSAFMLFPNNLMIHGNIIDDGEGSHLFQDSYEDEWGDITFCNSIKKIALNIIENDFISVIVPNQHKPKLLRQLDHLGINEAFLFPELEYTAKNLKEKYKYISRESQ